MTDEEAAADHEVKGAKKIKDDGDDRLLIHSQMKSNGNH